MRVFVCGLKTVEYDTPPNKSDQPMMMMVVVVMMG
jgi:hypothetical protein